VIRRASDLRSSIEALKSGSHSGLGRLPRDRRIPPCTPWRADADTCASGGCALEEAVDLACRGVIDAVVTGPIHKARMYDIGFQFPGQTEFFAERTGTANYAMLLTGGRLTVALVTTHVPLRRVVELLSKEEIVRVGLLLASSCGDAAALIARIAVAGLNPARRRIRRARD
jgi:4-hydroxythreonine-4-phosphate dehydrogenase